MREVTIYTSPTCPYCQRAKQLLSSLNVPYSEVDVAENQELREQLIEKYNWQTVPLVVIGEEFIGGYDDLARLHATGALMEKFNT